MIRKELIEQLAITARMPLAEAERFLVTFVNIIYTELRQGGTVNISGFGKFSVSHRAQRVGVDPRSLNKIVIPELITPKFVAGERFKQEIKLKN